LNENDFTRLFPVGRASEGSTVSFPSGEHRLKLEAVDDVRGYRGSEILQSFHRIGGIAGGDHNGPDLDIFRRILLLEIDRFLRTDIGANPAAL
jgi:hypothetical protein